MGLNKKRSFVQQSIWEHSHLRIAQPSAAIQVEQSKTNKYQSVISVHSKNEFGSIWSIRIARPRRVITYARCCSVLQAICLRCSVEAVKSTRHMFTNPITNYSEFSKLFSLLWVPKHHGCWVMVLDVVVLL